MGRILRGGCWFRLMLDFCSWVHFCRGKTALPAWDKSGARRQQNAAKLTGDGGVPTIAALLTRVARSGSPWNTTRIYIMKSCGFIACVATVVLGCLISGCSVGRATQSAAYAGKVLFMVSEPGPTHTMSQGDHIHNINTVIDQDTRGFFYDLDLVLQLDRPSRLSKWHDR